MRWKDIRWKYCFRSLSSNTWGEQGTVHRGFEACFWAWTSYLEKPLLKRRLNLNPRIFPDWRGAWEITKKYSFCHHAILNVVDNNPTVFVPSKTGHSRKPITSLSLSEDDYWVVLWQRCTIYFRGSAHQELLDNKYLAHSVRAQRAFGLKLAPLP